MNLRVMTVNVLFFFFFNKMNINNKPTSMRMDIIKFEVFE